MALDVFKYGVGIADMSELELEWLQQLIGERRAELKRPGITPASLFYSSFPSNSSSKSESSFSIGACNAGNFNS